MAKVKRLSKKKITIFVIILSVLTISLFFVIKGFMPSKEEYVDEIDEYGYYLKENTSSYHKSLFKTLKDDIEDEQKYAKLVGQLFLSDFYTLDKKQTKVDVGGVQYLYESYQDEFILSSSDTLYKVISPNNNDELPIVKEVIVKEVVQKEFGHIDSIYDPSAFIIDFEIIYEKDLGYDQEATLIIVRNQDNDKLEIAEMNTK